MTSKTEETLALERRLTRGEAKRTFDYDQHTGLMRWRIRPANCVHVGDIAGSPNKQGYLKLKLAGKTFSVHRVAWLIVYGHWPEHQIDHIDCDKTNNRIENLRDVEQGMNQQNRRSPRGDSSTGLLGAHKHMNSFKAAITIDGKPRHIGKFKTAAEAHAAYVEYKRTHHAGSTI